MKFKIRDFIRDVKSINMHCKDVNNPLMSIRHSEIIIKILNSHFHTYSILESLFIDVIERNNKISWGFDVYLRWSEIMNESIDKIQLVTEEAKSLFEYNKNYLIKLSNTKYCICYKTIVSGKQYLNFIFIICRNNNGIWEIPPIKKMNHIYICGNKIYSGYSLISEDSSKNIQTFKREYEKLSKNHSMNSMKILPNFKVKLEWNEDYGTYYSKDHVYNNQEYILDIFYHVKMNSILTEKLAYANYTIFKAGDIDGDLESIVEKSSAGICGWADANMN